MQLINRIIFWLALGFACFFPASALTPTAPENRVWEIFTTGYDAAETPITTGYDTPVKSTSAYDQSLIHSTGAKTRSAETERTLFGKIAEFKAAEGGGAGLSRLNIFGEGEAPGFTDVSTDARFATGGNGVTRPLTSSLSDASASDIFIRSAPLSDTTLSEITRLAAPGSRVTLMQALDDTGAFQSQKLIDAFGDRATVTLQKTFTTQFQSPGVPTGILKLQINP